MRKYQILSPNMASKEHKQFGTMIHKGCLAVLDPCKGHGRAHLARLIGSFCTNEHNIMTKICAGAQDRPESIDKMMALSLGIAIYGTLNFALVKLVEDPNTQWDDPDIFYDQLVNHIKNTVSDSSDVLVGPELPRD